MTAPVPQHASLSIEEVERQLNAPQRVTQADFDELNRLNQFARASIARTADLRRALGLALVGGCPHGWDPKDCALCGGGK